MRSIWHIDTNPDLRDVRAHFANLVGEEIGLPPNRRAYTDLSPTDHNEYLNKVQRDIIRPVLIYLHDHLVHMCWAHDKQEGLSCWSGLWTHYTFRGPESAGIRGDAYRKVISTYQESWGFKYVFCNVIGTNRGAIAAATTYWGYNLVGRYKGHRPVGGEPVDALMYLHSTCDDSNGRELCVKQAHAMAYPQPGEFIYTLSF